MNMEPLCRSALELRNLVVAKEISPIELLDRCLARMEEGEPKLNAFVTVTEEVARAAARKAEKAILDGDPPGLLHGLPISVKDLIAMDGVPFTFGSRLAAENVAAVDAPAVERVRNEGGVIVGKTATSEFGCKAVGDSPLTGITRNPWDLSKTPGGSSAGAAASVDAVRARHRRWRLGPHPRLADGPVRDQGAVRPRAGVPRGCDPDPRPRRPHGPHGARCRAAAERGGGVRPARPVRRRRAGAGLPGRLRPAGEGDEGRVEPDARIRRPRERGRRTVRAGGAHPRRPRMREG